MSEFMRQFWVRILFLKFIYMLDLKNIDQKLQKSYVRKAGTIAKKGIRNFWNHAFLEKIRKNWGLKFGRTGVDHLVDRCVLPVDDTVPNSMLSSKLNFASSEHRVLEHEK